MLAEQRVVFAAASSSIVLSAGVAMSILLPALGARLAQIADLAEISAASIRKARDVIAHIQPAHITTCVSMMSSNCAHVPNACNQPASIT
jgi:hypothetical protein